MALEYILNQYEQKSKIIILIFDDIERISDNVDFDWFLGTIEFLVQTYRYVKILFVANLSQFSELQRAIWEKYSEKVVRFSPCCKKASPRILRGFGSNVVTKSL